MHSYSNSYNNRLGLAWLVLVYLAGAWEGGASLAARGCGMEGLLLYLCARSLRGCCAKEHEERARKRVHSAQCTRTRSGEWGLEGREGQLERRERGKVVVVPAIGHFEKPSYRALVFISR